MKRSARISLVIALAGGMVAPVHAGLPVFDAANFTSNVIQNFQLLGIKKSLTKNTPGTVVHNTLNIDNSTKNIDKSTEIIKDTSISIDNSTKQSLQIDIDNIEINTSFEWIINNSAGEEIIPIPRSVQARMAALTKDQSFESYAANFRDAASYLGNEAPDTGAFGIEGSRAKKAANDMMATSIEIEKDGIQDEFNLLNGLVEQSNEARGHGHQLQIANALAGTQAHQIMKLRNTVLVGEAQRAAEAQADADREARAIAVAHRMRAGLSRAVNASNSALLRP